MKKFASILFIAAILLVTLFAIAGCNTFEGFGKDIQRSGEVIQNAAD